MRPSQLRGEIMTSASSRLVRQTPRPSIKPRPSSHLNFSFLLWVRQRDNSEVFYEDGDHGTAFELGDDTARHRLCQFEAQQILGAGALHAPDGCASSQADAVRAQLDSGAGLNRLAYLDAQPVLAQIDGPCRCETRVALMLPGNADGRHVGDA